MNGVNHSACPALFYFVTSKIRGVSTVSYTHLNIASQAQTEYRMMLESALNAGITPIEIKEILYQAVAYAGMAKVCLLYTSILDENLKAPGNCELKLWDGLTCFD